MRPQVGQPELDQAYFSITSHPSIPTPHKHAIDIDRLTPNRRHRARDQSFSLYRLLRADPSNAGNDAPGRSGRTPEQRIADASFVAIFAMVQFSLSPRAAVTGMPDESQCYASRMTVSIEIPDDLAEALAPDGDLPHRALETLAVDGYRHELLSQVQVGKLLGLSRVQTEDFLAKHVDLIDYDASELQRESEALKKISQRSPRS